MASALVVQGWKYWLFVLGFALGACSTGLTKYAVAFSAIIGVIQEVLQQYCVFLQAGVLAGVFVRMTRL